jgi:hypothetical protein
VALGILGLAACRTDVTPEDRRWRSPEGESVFAASGPSILVHTQKDRPDLDQPEGEIRVCTAKDGPLMDASGNVVGSPRERQPPRPSCVKQTGNNSSAERVRLGGMRLLSAVLAASALAACGDRSNAGPAPLKEREVMTPITTTARLAAPPIDLAVPSKVETATFALG